MENLLTNLRHYLDTTPQETILKDWAESAIDEADRIFAKIAKRPYVNSVSVKYMINQILSSEPTITPLYGEAKMLIKQIHTSPSDELLAVIHNHCKHLGYESGYIELPSLDIYARGEEYPYFTGRYVRDSESVEYDDDEGYYVVKHDLSYSETPKYDYKKEIAIKQDPTLVVVDAELEQSIRNILA